MRGQAAAPGGDQRAMVTLTVDGVPVTARAGDLLTTVLARAGLLRLRVSPRTGAPRGAFCQMGLCQECALHVDGVVRQACLTPVRAGMAVERRGVL